MQQTENLQLILRESIDDDEWQVAKNQFSGSGDAARTTELWIFCQQVGTVFNRVDYPARCQRVIRRNKCLSLLQAPQARTQPPNTHLRLSV